MKTVFRLVVWAAVGAAIIWWPTRPTSFNARWVALPPAMSWDTISKARKASQHPAFCPYAWAEKCRVS